MTPKIRPATKLGFSVPVLERGLQIVDALGDGVGQGGDGIELVSVYSLETLNLLIDLILRDTDL